MTTTLLVPALSIGLLVLVAGLLAAAAGRLSFRRKGERGALGLPYAGGESLERHRVQVDYGQFFPFAFFFTILHVVTLIVATSPGHSLQGLAIAGAYVLGALLGLFILFRR